MSARTGVTSNGDKIANHWLTFPAPEQWGCHGCNWVGRSLADYIATHELSFPGE